MSWPGSDLFSGTGSGTPGAWSDETRLLGMVSFGRNSQFEIRVWDLCLPLLDLQGSATGQPCQRHIKTLQLQFDAIVAARRYG